MIKFTSKAYPSDTFTVQGWAHASKLAKEFGAVASYPTWRQIFFTRTYKHTASGRKYTSCYTYISKVYSLEMTFDFGVHDIFVLQEVTSKNGSTQFNRVDWAFDEGFLEKKSCKVYLVYNLPENWDSLTQRDQNVWLLNMNGTQGVELKNSSYVDFPVFYSFIKQAKWGFKDLLQPRDFRGGWGTLRVTRIN